MSNRTLASVIVRRVWLLGLLLCFSVAGEAQKKPAPPTSGSSKSPSVRPGVLAALTEESLTLQDKVGAKTEYALNEKTVYRRGRKLAERTDFKTGENIVVRLRKVRNKSEYYVFELTDPPTFEWLDSIRRKPMTGTLREQTEDRLTVAFGQDEFIYTVSEKTHWSKGNREVSPSAFKAGDTVTVVPRALPSGGVWGRIVADSLPNANAAKEKTSLFAKGSIQKIETTERAIALAAQGGGTRLFRYDDATEVRQKSKTVPLTTLRPGLKVTVRLRRSVQGEEVATRITIDAGTVKSARIPPKPAEERNRRDK